MFVPAERLADLQCLMVCVNVLQVLLDMLVKQLIVLPGHFVWVKRMSVDVRKEALFHQVCRFLQLNVEEEVKKKKKKKRKKKKEKKKKKKRER